MPSLCLYAYKSQGYGVSTIMSSAVLRRIEKKMGTFPQINSSIAGYTCEGDNNAQGRSPDPSSPEQSHGTDALPALTPPHNRKKLARKRKECKSTLPSVYHRKTTQNGRYSSCDLRDTCLDPTASPASSKSSWSIQRHACTDRMDARFYGEDGLPIKKVFYEGPEG